MKYVNPSAESSPESATLAEIFNRDKAAALETVRKLTQLIPQIKLNSSFGNDEASYQNRPMQPLRLAQELCYALENLESVKLIIANEIYKD
jgi:hypothetical protein